MRLAAVFVVTIVYMSATLLCRSHAQESTKQTWQPTKPYSVDSLRQANLSSLWVCKLAADGAAIKLLRPVLKIETSKEPILVTKTYFQTVTKTREKEGGGVETYNEQISYTTEEPSYPQTAIPEGIERFSLPLKNAKAWRLDGHRIEVEQLAKELKVARHLFASEYIRDDFSGVDPYYQVALRPDMIFLQLPPTFLTDPKFREEAKK